MRSAIRAASVLTLALAAAVAPAAGGAASAGDGGSAAAVRAAQRALPLHFEPASAEGQFVAAGTGYGLLIGPGSSTLVLAAGRAGRTPLGTVPSGSVLRVRLVGANASARAEASEVLPGRAHSFRGASPSGWRRDVAMAGRVTYREVYPGVDLTYYGNGGALEHDFVVRPAADASVLRMALEGAVGVRLDEAGDLVVAMPGGEVRQRKPVAYQLIGGERRTVACRYVFEDEGRIAIRVGDYDASRPLVVDPVVEYATFVGGSGADAGQDVAVAPDGTLWVVGTTFSVDLPGAGSGGSGDQDVFVSHFAADGRTLLSVTLVGGANADFGNRVKVNGSGVYVAGGTVSSDFPSPDAACAVCRNPPAGLASWELFDPPSDAQSVLFELDLSGVLRHAVVFGGSGMDNAWVLGIDAAGTVHVGSNSCGDGFPTTPLAYRPTRTPASGADVNDACDVAIARFTESSAGFSLAYGTYLGGSGADFVAGLAVTPDGADWVVGGTSSADFPTTAGARQAANRGGFDAFVARLAASGAALDSSTYLGGSGYDYPFDVALDGGGRPYVVGRTESADFPSTAGAFQPANAGGSDGFVARFTRAGDLAWSTLLGGSGFDWPFAVGVSGSGSVYVAGQTSSANFPVVLPAQAQPGGAEDAFVARLAPNGSALRWSTRLGGPGSDLAHGLAPDGQGGVWVVGNTGGGLASASDAVQPSFGGGASDAFLVRLDEKASIRLRPSSLLFRPTRVGRRSAPRQVVVRNNGSVDVDVLDVSLGGASPGDYVLANGCPATLAPGDACSVAVRFAPVAAGARDASLLVRTSASAAPSAVELGGTGF